MITLEIGKFYKTRSGDLAYCIGVNPFNNTDGDNWIVVLNSKYTALHWYFNNGNFMYQIQDDKEQYDKDIVSEVKA